LRFQMQQHGLSQYQLAKEGWVSQSYLSKILRGEREMGKKLAQVLANRFGLPTGFFL
jgi:antitoxin component HigA of HigAB toxin-antitoxin module